MKSQICWGLSLLIFLMGGNACHKKLLPANVETSMNIDQIPLSVINLPVQISRSELNRVTRELMMQIFKDDLVLEGGFLCHIQPEPEIDIQAVRNEIHFDIPLQLEIRHKSQFQQIKAIGTLELNLNTKVEVFNQQFLSKTEMLQHRWIKSPVIKLLGVSLPIETIANQLIKKYKSKLIQSIDQQLMGTVDLAKLGQKINHYFKSPFFTSDDGILKVYVTPQEFALGPIFMNDQFITFPAIFYLENTISENIEINRRSGLDFSTRPFSDTSSVFAIQSRIPLQYIEQLLREQLLTQEFGNSMAKVKIQNLVLEGLGEQFDASFETTGSFKGKFKMHFVPGFDKESKKIQLKDFKLNIVSGKGMSKSLYTLLKNKLEKISKEAIESQLNTFMLDYLNTSELFLADKTITNGVKLKGKIDQYQIKDFWIFDKRMYFTVLVDLHLAASVDYIDQSVLIKR
ncbi:MAG: DUF4403 family protein [Saprospiraceae bacterium]|nr:DUF4403 family protein [Saprospiraceae bacterium]